MDQDKQDAQFIEWLEDHRGIVAKVARSFAIGRDADDLVQEILLQLWKSTSTFRGDSSPSTWVYRVALNRALTWQRDEGKNSSRVSPLAEIADFAAPDAMPGAQRLEQVYASLRTFPRIDRSLLLLSLDGYSYAQMADLTGMSASNVGARLSRARKRLINELEDNS